MSIYTVQFSTFTQVEAEDEIAAITQVKALLSPELKFMSVQVLSGAQDFGTGADAVTGDA